MNDKNLIILIVYVGYLVLMSLCAFFLYGKDKRMAQKNNSAVRIKEKTLLWVVCFGGAVGGFLGRIIFHHKTDKVYFSFTIYLSLLLQAAVLGLLVFFYFNFRG